MLGLYLAYRYGRRKAQRILYQEQQLIEEFLYIQEDDIEYLLDLFYEQY